MLKFLVEDAIQSKIERDENGKYRKPGFHASSAGYCVRKVILELMAPELVIPFDDKLKRVFYIGTMMHDELDLIVREHIMRNDEWEYMQPRNLNIASSILCESYADVSSHEMNPFCTQGVLGTPDLLLLNKITDKLHGTDFKTSNERALAMKKRKGASIANMLQVATYSHSEGGMQSQWPLYGVADPTVMYINKSDWEKVEYPVSLDNWLPKVDGYWAKCARALANFDASNGEHIPPPVPEEKWQCGYCNVCKSHNECEKVLSFSDYKELANDRSK